MSNVKTDAASSRDYVGPNGQIIITTTMPGNNDLDFTMDFGNPQNNYDEVRISFTLTHKDDENDVRFFFGTFAYEGPDMDFSFLVNVDANLYWLELTTTLVLENGEQMELPLAA